jgi:hypothetical protein
MRTGLLRHKFVDLIPDELEDRTIYISILYATMAHKCCCGCGNEVATPLTPTDWRVTFDGETVSVAPSIGNWSYPCQSHYWIDHNRVRWARHWSTEEISRGRRGDQVAKKKYFGIRDLQAADEAVVADSGLLAWIRKKSRNCAQYVFNPRRRH